MVYIPYPPQMPPLDPPLSGEMVGLEIQRNLTHWFIQQDPTPIVLTPQTSSRTGNGSIQLSAQAPRAEQIVKLIFATGNIDGIVGSTEGQERKYDFVLVAEWNASVQINDYWIDENSQYWIVTGLSPYNGYEVKAGIVSYGKVAVNG